MADNIKVGVSVVADQSSVNALRGSIQSQLNNLKVNLGGTGSSSISGGTGNVIKNIGTASEKAAKQVKGFGDQLNFTATRLAAYYVAAGAFFRLTSAIGTASEAVVDLDKQVNRLTQIFNGNKKVANDLTDQIIEFGVAYGQSAREVLKIADTIAQAGDKFGGTAKDIAEVTSAIAKTNLAATFGKIEDTTEGVVAVLNQFNLSGRDTIKVLDLANGLAKQFAFEASDMFEAVKAGGGAFALADGDIKNFAATITALRSITRLSASSIGTALNTISVRNLKEDVIQFTDELTGGKIRNADGSLKGLTQRFIEIARATQSFSDEALGPVLEKISDTRQAKFLIPLIRDIQKGGNASQFLKALDASKKQAGSLSRDVALGLDRIEVQLGSVGAKFEEVFKAISQDQGIKDLVKYFADLAKGAASAVKFLLPLIPVLAKFGTAAIVLKGSTFAAGKIAGSGVKSAAASQKASEDYAIKQLIASNPDAISQLGISKERLKSLGFAVVQPKPPKPPKTPRAASSRSRSTSSTVSDQEQQILVASQIVQEKAAQAQDFARQRTNIAAFLAKQNAPALGSLQVNPSKVKSDFQVTAEKTRDISGKFLNTAQKASSVFVVKDQDIKSGFSPSKYKTPLFPSVEDKALPSVYRTKSVSDIEKDANKMFLAYTAANGGAQGLRSSSDKFSTSTAITDGEIARIGQKVVKNQKLSEVGIATNQMNRYLSAVSTPTDYENIKRATQQRNISSLLGTGIESRTRIDMTDPNHKYVTENVRAQRVRALEELERVDPQLRQNRSITKGIDDDLLNVGGKRQILRQKSDRLAKALDVAAKQFTSAGGNSDILAKKMNSITIGLESLRQKDALLLKEEDGLLLARKQLAASSRSLVEVQQAEAAIKAGQSPVGKAGIFSRGVGIAQTGLSKAGGFVSRNSGLLLNTAGILGSIKLDQLAGGAAENIQSGFGDKFSRQISRNTLTQANIDKFSSNNKSARTKSGFFGGASTGLSITAPLAASLIASGVGAPAGLAVAAGGALIGGTLGALGGGAENQRAQQKELLSTLSTTKSGSAQGLLGLNLLRSIKKEGGFEGGGFSFVGSAVGTSGNSKQENEKSNFDAATLGTVNAFKRTKNFFSGGPKLFQNEFRNKLDNTEEGKGEVQRFREAALAKAATFTPSNLTNGNLREALIKEETANFIKAAQQSGKKLSAEDALIAAQTTVAEKMRAAGLDTDELGSTLGDLKKSMEDGVKNFDRLSKEFGRLLPSIIGFSSKFSETTQKIGVNTQFRQASRGISDSVISGVFGNTTSINNAGLGKVISEKLKSDIDSSASAYTARDVVSNSLGGFLGQSDLAVFKDIASVQRGLGGINENIVSRFGGKTFAGTDNVEQQISRVLSELFKAQGISVQTGEGKDLLDKIKESFKEKLSTDKGRAEFNQNKAGFTAKFLQEFGASLDLIGERLEKRFGNLQDQMDRSNQSFAQYIIIQKKLIEVDNQKLNNSLSRIKDLSSIGATSEQSGGAISGLIRGLNPNIANGSTVVGAAGLVAQRTREAFGINSQMETLRASGKAPSEELQIRANNAQQRLTEAQDQYNRSINDANNAMTLLRARVEETSKQFNTLMGTAKSIGSQSTGQFTGEKFQLEQSSSLLGGFAKRLSAAGVGSADQFVTLSKEKQNALLGDTRGLLGSEQLSSLLPVLDKNSGLKFNESNITAGNASDILKAAIAGNTNIQGFQNTGTGLNALGKSRQADLSTIANIQNSQLDSMNIINQSVIGIYEYLTRGSKNPDDQKRLKELQQSQQTNLQNQPTNKGGANPVNSGGNNNQTQQITQVLQTIQTSLQNNSSDNLSKAMNALTTALQNATGKKSEFKFDGKVNIQGLDKAGRDQAIGQVVVSVLQAFYKELDKSDPAESQLAEKLQNAIKTIVKEK